MQILLDTNAALWLVADDPRLGPQARKALTRASRCLWSAVSSVEIQIKVTIGKLHVPDDLRRRFEEAGVVESPLLHGHAEAMARSPELRRHDPFDRMLVAQALTEGFVLLTSDEVLLELVTVPTIDARV